MTFSFHYPGSVGELPGLVVDLGGQLPGGSQHQRQWGLLAPAVAETTTAARAGRRAILEKP